MSPLGLWVNNAELIQSKSLEKYKSFVAKETFWEICRSLLNNVARELSLLTQLQSPKTTVEKERLSDVCVGNFINWADRLSELISAVDPYEQKNNARVLFYLVKRSRALGGLSHSASVRCANRHKTRIA